jgi:hypothetical protein
MFPELVEVVCAIVGRVVALANPSLSISVVITTPYDNAAAMLRHIIKI